METGRGTEGEGERERERERERLSCSMGKWNQSRAEHCSSCSPIVFYHKLLSPFGGQDPNLDVVMTLKSCELLYCNFFMNVFHQVYQGISPTHTPLNLWDLFSSLSLRIVTLWCRVLLPLLHRKHEGEWGHFQHSLPSLSLWMSNDHRVTDIPTDESLRLTLDSG